MGHNFNLNKQSLQKIDNLLPRLKHSVSSSKIINWLENFDDDREMELALDLLSVYEYIPFNEFMFRLNDLLKELFKKIPKGDKIIVFPYGKVGKSATLVTYPLKNTDAFKSRKDDILMTHDYENVKNPTLYKHIIFIDDFIGSGKTFCKEFSKPDYIQQWIKHNKIDNVYILSSIMMVEGQDYILDRFPEIKIVSEERNKIFDTSLSPLKILGTLKEIKRINSKHGKKIPVSGSHPFYAHLGYDNSESLISFFHCTPNNTLPILWGKSSKWNPLFPRMANIRMDEAREFKKEIAFYIGICNRLGIDILTGKSIIEVIKGKYVRKKKNNNKQDHSIVALLQLKSLGHDNLIICHLLGLSREELRKVYIEAKYKGLVKTKYDLSTKGIQFLKDLKSKTQKENFRKETDQNLAIKEEILYLPQMLDGLT
ncbi:phosphoribosyltransferase-like protein [Flavobacterium sp.]|uniref:phosphoribosyltransferase-like protein n=1 Tax=Flavobacterium sp. TaxID=239 RepID=UPI002ED7B7D3